MRLSPFFQALRFQPFVFAYRYPYALGSGHEVKSKNTKR